MANIADAGEDHSRERLRGERSRLQFYPSAAVALVLIVGSVAAQMGWRGSTTDLKPPPR